MPTPVHVYIYISECVFTWFLQSVKMYCWQQLSIAALHLIHHVVTNTNSAAQTHMYNRNTPRMSR